MAGTSQLDRFLASIDPERTLNEVDARADEAMRTFPFRAGAIERWDEFTSCMGAYYRHVLTTILRVRRPSELDLEFCWGKCVWVLHQLYGSSGEKAAFEYARTGAEGGLYGVMKSVARHLADESAQNEIRARASRFWEELTVDEKMAVSTEYIRKFGHLLPSELTEGSAARIRASFWKVLERHPALIRRFTRLGR